MRPYSGGLLQSEIWIQPPRPADPAPPCPLAPPAESPDAARFLPPRRPVNSTPPELRFAPDVDTITCACDCASGSSCACLAKTSWRIPRNLGFSVSESVVGGNLVEDPIARSGFTGSDGKSDRVCHPFGPGNAYYQHCQYQNKFRGPAIKYNMWVPLEGRDTAKLNPLVAVQGLPPNRPRSKHLVRCCKVHLNCVPDQIPSRSPV